MFTAERLACSNRWRTQHPGDKVVLGGGLLVLAVTLPPWPGGGLVLLAAVLTALFGARLPPLDYARVLGVPAGFLLTGAVALAVSVDVVDYMPLIVVSREGVVQAAAASVRAIAATASLLLIVLTTPITDLIALGRRLRLPAVLVDLMLMTWRFAVLAVETAATVRAAQASRLGYAGFGRSIRSAGVLSAHLLPRVLDRAARMQVGLGARGYTGDLRVLTPSRGHSRVFVSATLVLQAAIVLLSLKAVGTQGLVFGASW